MAMDGQLWFDLYRRHWHIGFKLEAKLDHTKKTLKVLIHFVEYAWFLYYCSLTCNSFSSLSVCVSARAWSLSEGLVWAVQAEDTDRLPQEGGGARLGQLLLQMCSHQSPQLHHQDQLHRLSGGTGQ